MHLYWDRVIASRGKQAIVVSGQELRDYWRRGYKIGLAYEGFEAPSGQQETGETSVGHIGLVI